MKSFPLKISNQLHNVLWSDLFKSEWEMDTKDYSLLCLIVIYKQFLTVFFLKKRKKRKGIFILPIQIEKTVSYLLRLLLWLEN